MSSLIIPESYRPGLGVIETEQAIKSIKDVFETELSSQLNLSRVSAPLFVQPETGLNDDLNGIEKAVEFDIKDIDKKVQIIHSLAKWKRFSLKRYDFPVGEGIYADMNAIRKDEELDNLHSIYVDQWDWEKIICKEQRSIDYLYSTVRKIIHALKRTQKKISYKSKFTVPDDIFFITSQELEDMYPHLTPKEREHKIAEQYGAVFISKIGRKLKSGSPHDGRAPDYDDWDLNGDIIVWYPVLKRSVELSSMGIRVDESSLQKQLEESNCRHRMDFEFHKMLMSSQLPLTIGGGIGQSRICMLLLDKVHIGEVQASIWPQETIDQCKENNIHLL